MGLKEALISRFAQARAAGAGKGSAASDSRRDVLRQAVVGNAAAHILHANPLAAPGGLERVLLELSRFGKQRCNTTALWLYPMAEGIAVIANEEELFRAPVEDVVELFEDLAGRGELKLSSVFLHHTMHWQRAGLLRMLGISSVARRSVVYIHDAHMICPERALDYQGEVFLSPPDDVRAALCPSCIARDASSGHWRANAELLARFDRVVVPSSSARRIALSIYPELEKRLSIVPHCTLGPSTPCPQDGERSAIVFFGATGRHKGAHLFEALVGRFRDRYRFVSVGIEERFRALGGVEHRHFNFLEHDALGEIVRDLRPAVAFLGSVIPETFSFTLHEALREGLPVVTTSQSGNIAETVQQLECGVAFSSVSELMSFFEDEKSVRALLSTSKRFAVEPNDSSWRELLG